MKTAFTAAVFALLVFFPVFVSGQSCSHGDIRLVGGSNELEGRVEVCSSGLWGTVCDNSWDYRDAGVVCRQLGYAYEGAIARFSAYFGYTSYPSVRLTSVMCSGSELRLIDCSYSNDTDMSDDYYDHCDQYLAEYYDYYHNDDYDLYFFCYILGCCDHFPWHHYCNHYDDAGVTCLPGVTNNTVLEVDTTDLDTDIESVRLVNFNNTFSNMGRLEVKYNGTWGTVCDRFWSYSDARVACGMLGFDDAACAVTTNKFGTAENSVPFLMDSVQCLGHEEALDQCTFTGWGNTVYLCSHRSNYAGVVCANTSQIGTPYNIRLVDSTTTTITINFTVPELPDVVEGLRYYISYQSETSSFPSYTTYIASGHREGDEVSYSFTSLTRDTEYTAQIRVQVLYSVCGRYVSGNYSDPVTIRTNATSKLTTIPTRLVSPYPGVDFLGRVEIFYNNQWGTICDDFFSTIDANVICLALNFTDGAVCAVSNARYGAGTGPIWLDDVGCRAVDEVLEDCYSRGWGVHNCGHRSDVGVVCTPNDLPPVKDVRVTSVSHTSVTVAWTEHSFPRGYSSASFQLVYKSQGVSNTLALFKTLTEYRLRGLRFEQQYNISLRARLQYRYCSAYIYGQYSNEVSITTMETAPDGPPTSFELEAINTTAIEAMWELPSINNRNGFIRGYRLFVQRVGGEAWNITIPDNTTLAYIVGGLQKNTHYTFSVLAYTVADGPKSIHLTAATLLYDPLITEFGLYGSGVDKLIRYTFNNGLQVHCTTSSDPSIVRTDWYFANGTKVGLVDSNFREGHYLHNKTTVLQIGLNRRLTYCDGGNYTCVVQTNSSRTESRSFHLLIGTSAPSPSRPTAVNIKSTSITIAWSQPLCDGGHTPKSYRIRYRRSSSYAFYNRIVVRDPTQRNYTIMGLSSTTLYDLSVSYTTVDSRTSSYSLAVTVSTLPPAPSAPRDVTVRLVRPLLAEVSWREPATPNGAITHYTVYATPQLSLGPERRKRQTTTVPPNVKKSFPSTVTSGNITLSNYSISYQFQVSASTSYGQVANEGELSPISANATIFVPEPGLPAPVDIRMSTITNTSITLSWMYPPPPVHPIESYYVTYSGEVEWRSPGGALLQFDDEGELSVTGTTAVISPLIPGIRYHFKVSAITTIGRGGEVDAFGSTQVYPGSLAHFQLRITPVFSCLELTSPGQNNIEEFRSAIVDEINDQVCPRCRLTTANIKEDQFSCRGLTNHIVYRAMLVGTGTYSAPDIVSLLQMWVASGSASISALSTRLHLDKDCDTVLDTLDDPVCPLQVVSETTTTTQAAVSKTTTPKPDDKGPSSNPITGEHIRVGEVLGFVLGIAIIVLLGILIVVIIIVAAKKFKSKPNKSVSHERIFSDASFAHMGPGSNRESVNLYDIDDKDDRDLGK